MKYGASYYPEHKDRAAVDRDIALIRECGMNVIRMGEFAWCRFEPAEGKYDFAWLDEVVEKLGQSGIESILCTPTACPPAWLVEKHPEILYTDNRGVVRPFGGRRHYCYNSPVYREYSRKIAGEIGRHYGGNPNVFAFQIDNEPAQEGTGRCHCPVCAEKFHQWLERKYGTVEILNKKWGTVFWSQEYNHFGQIPLPVTTIEPFAQQKIQAHFENPSLRLDFERFCSDSNIEYQNIQKEVLKKYTEKTVTTNATGIATNSINYYESFKELDVYAYDFYPGLRDREISSFSYSFGRGVKDAPFWLLEFVSGGGHRMWGSGRLQPYPGAMKQAVLHAFAAGADLLAHFQLKTFPYGAEQLNYAIVDIDGVPRRRYFEVQETARELKRLEPLLRDSGIVSQAAICFDYDALWSHRIKPVNADTFDYLDYCVEIYDVFVQLGIGVDVVSSRHSLEGYKLVVVPAPFVMEGAFKSQLKKYVYNGGTLISTFLTGVKNEYNVGLETSLPCGLTELFGITVSEVEPVFESTAANISLELDKAVYNGTNKYWTEVLESCGAKLPGTYTNGFRKNLGIVSRSSYGKGTAWYMGTGLEEQLLRHLLLTAVKECGISRVPFRLEKGMEVIERQQDGKSIYFIFNFHEHEVKIPLDGNRVLLPEGTVIQDEVAIGPKGVLILG